MTFSPEMGTAMRWGKSVLVPAVLFLTGIAHAQPDKVLYELQERCGKQARQVYDKDWGGGTSKSANGETNSNYQNHYNKRLNKCFYLEMSNVIQRVNDKMTSTNILRLFDLNENKEYGSFISGDLRNLSLCEVQGKMCGSESEWRELVKPFMEE